MNEWSSGSSSYVVYTTGFTTSNCTTTTGSVALASPNRTELERLDERVDGTCLAGRKALGLQ